MPGVLYIDTWQVLLMPGVLIYTWQVLLMDIVIYGMQFLRHKSSYTYGKYQSRQVLLTGTARVLLTARISSLGMLCFIQPGICLKN